MSDRKSRIITILILMVIAVAMLFLSFTKENYIRYSFYDATGYQYSDVTRMEDTQGDSTRHLLMYKYGYFKPCHIIPKCKAKEIYNSYNIRNEFLFSISEYDNNIVKIESGTKSEFYQYILRD